MEEQPQLIEVGHGLWVQACPNIFIVIRRTSEEEAEVALMSQAEGAWHEWTVTTINAKEANEKIKQWKREQGETNGRQD